jgi:hypothetical protein
MNNLNFNKLELLKIIRENRDKHREVFEESYEGFYQALLEQLDKMKEAALARKKVNLHLGLSEPKDQTGEYDRAIRMLELSTDESVSLDEQQFANYVLDEWHWKAQFIASNTMYSESIRSGKYK